MSFWLYPYEEGRGENQPIPLMFFSPKYPGTYSLVYFMTLKIYLYILKFLEQWSTMNVAQNFRRIYDD